MRSAKHATMPAMHSLTMIALLVLPLAACKAPETPAEQRQRVLDTMKAECIYVGEWKATRINADYTVVLLENGKFTAAPNDGRGSEMAGKWGVLNGKMVWIYEDMPGKRPEANPIES